MSNPLTEEERIKVEEIVLRETAKKHRKVLNIATYSKGGEPYLFVKFSDGVDRKIRFKKPETRDHAAKGFAEHRGNS